MKAGRRKLNRRLSIADVCRYAKEHHISYGKAVIEIERVSNTPASKAEL